MSASDPDPESEDADGIEPTPPERETDALPWWHPFVYQARPVTVIDGDTQYYRLDLGFHFWWHEVAIRLLDVDTAETHFVAHDSEEYERGQLHTDFAAAWLLTAREQWAGEWPVVVATELDRRGAYGRVLGRVYRKCDGDELNAALLREFGEEVAYE